jgi:hypothetical protein
MIFRRRLAAAGAHDPSDNRRRPAPRPSPGPAFLAPHGRSRPQHGLPEAQSPRPVFFMAKLSFDGLEIDSRDSRVAGQWFLVYADRPILWPWHGALGTPWSPFCTRQSCAPPPLRPLRPILLLGLGSLSISSAQDIAGRMSLPIRDMRRSRAPPFPSSPSAGPSSSSWLALPATAPSRHQLAPLPRVDDEADALRGPSAPASPRAHPAS